MDRLITAVDVAKRDGVNVEGWVRAVSARFYQAGRIRAMWDGRTVSGEPVRAVVRQGRVLAQCDVCGSYEYVDDKHKLFYCMSCGNDGSKAARPVAFPDDWQAVALALMARPVVDGMGRDYIERRLRSKPVIRGLGRNWDWGTSAETLEKENKKAFGKRTRGGE